MPRVLWRQDNGNRTVFQNVEDFELFLVQSFPHFLSFIANIIVAIICWAEISLEMVNHEVPNSYRGIFYQQHGPLNKSVQFLKWVLGPKEEWGTARVIHDEGEPRWPPRLDYEFRDP